MNSPAPRALALRTTGVTYPGSPEHISAVRADLRPLLRGCPMADDVILCASELAANAAIHSHSRLPGGTFTVRAKISPGDYAWIEVEDNGGPWTPAVRDPSPAPRARHRPRPGQRMRHRRRPARPHHLGPLRLDRVMATRPTGHHGPMDSRYRWPAAAGTPSPAGAIPGRAGQAGGSQRPHRVQARTAASLLLPQPDPGPTRSRLGRISLRDRGQHGSAPGLTRRDSSPCEDFLHCHQGRACGAPAVRPAGPDRAQ